MKPAPRRTLLAVLVAVTAVALAPFTAATAQTVTTDLPDYMPGWVVTITGGGWLPGETVSLVIHEDPQLNPDVSLSAVADAGGNFTNSSFVVPWNAEGTSYVVTATGQTSFSSAQAAFTDAMALGSLCAAVAGHGAAVCPSAGGAAGVLGQGVTHYSQPAGSTATYQIIAASDAFTEPDTAAFCPGGVKVLIKSTPAGNALLCGSVSGTVSGTTVTFSWTAQGPAGGAICETTVVAYKTDQNTNAQGQVTSETFKNANNDILSDGLDNGDPDAIAGIGVVDGAGNVIADCVQQSTSSITQIHDADHNDITGQVVLTVTTISAHDHVTVTGTSNPPTGTVTFSFFSGNDACSGAPTATQTLDLSSGAASGSSVTLDATSFAHTLGPGFYSFQATYNGNGNFAASTGACEPLTVASPELPSATITTQIHDGDGNDITGATRTIYYVQVHDRVTVTGSGPVPTGSVTFRLFATGDCSGPSAEETIGLAVGSTSSVADSTPFVPTAAGALSYLVDYSGDQHYSPTLGQVCEPLALGRIQPGLATEIHFPDHSLVGGNPVAGAIVHDSGAVSAPAGNIAALPAPTGSVSFTFFSGGDCSTGAPSAAGSAAVGGWTSSAGSGGTGKADGSTPEGPLAAGSYAFRASYPGDAVYKPVQSACEPLQVDRQLLCPEDSSRASLITRTVDPGGIFHGVTNHLTLQEAYNAAQASARGTEVIGMFGNTRENVTLGGAKSLTITQCTLARITAADNALPVWNITATGKLLIVGPDSVGGTVGWQVAGNGAHKLSAVRASGASQYGILVVSGNNSVSWNSVSGNAVGLRVTGRSNDLRGGTISGNTGDGAQIAGSSNSFQGATVRGNGGNGVQVSGASNTIKNNTSQANGRDGFNVGGATNLLYGNTASANSGDGFEIAASGNKLQNNQSNTAAPGGASENKGYEYRLTVAATNLGGNRADGLAIPKKTGPAKCPTFPAAGLCE